MNNTGFTNNYTGCFWSFIEEYLPNYSSRDDVLCDDILFRFITNDEVCEEDLAWIANDFNSDKKLVKDELVRLETKFAEEALGAYYNQYHISC